MPAQLNKKRHTKASHLTSHFNRHHKVASASESAEVKDKVYKHWSALLSFYCIAVVVWDLKDSTYMITAATPLL